MAHTANFTAPVGEVGGPRIKRILKSYQESANSMSGPKMTFTTAVQYPSEPDPKNHVKVEQKELSYEDSKPPSLRRIVHIPEGIVDAKKQLSRKRLESFARDDPKSLSEHQAICPISPAQISESEVIHTELEGEKIAGFSVGGEIRLCLQGILRQVLYNFTLEQIHSVCEKLSINLATCAELQLNSLKQSGILPPNTTRCGLIKKTDSERLCRALLYPESNTAKSSESEKHEIIMGRDALMVVHECFGGCRGVVALDRYISDKAKCVQCSECLEMFTPSKFVAHCHKDPEHRACHWGFNQDNWRSYLMLSEDIDVRDYERMATALEGFKHKFKLSQKEKVEVSENADLLPVKRARLSTTGSASSTLHTTSSSSSDNQSSSITRAAVVVRKLRESLSSQSDGGESLRDGSVFGREVGLPPYLLTGDPVLVQHSAEKSAPHLAEKYRSEPGYTPNVSLDPTPYLELRAKYPDLVHENDLAQTALRDLSSEVKGQRSTAEFSADDNVFRGIDDEDDDDDDDDDEMKIETQSVMSDKINLEDVDEVPPTLEVMIELASACTGDPDDDPSAPRLAALMKRDKESKLSLVHSILEARGSLSEAEEKEKLEKFMEIQNRQKELIKYLGNRCANDEKKLCEMERVLRDKDAELAAAKSRHEDEMTRIRHENATKMREAALERYELLKQIDALANGTNSSEIAHMAAQYKDEADRYRQRLLDVEASNVKLQQELNHLRSAVETSARDSRILALAPSTATPLGWYPPPGTTWVVAVKQEK